MGIKPDRYNNSAYGYKGIYRGSNGRDINTTSNRDSNGNDKGYNKDKQKEIVYGINDNNGNSHLITNRMEKESKPKVRYEYKGYGGNKPPYDYKGYNRV